MINLNSLVKDLPSARQLNLEQLAEQLTPNAEARSYFNSLTLPARAVGAQAAQLGKGIYDIGYKVSQGAGINEALASTDINSVANVSGLLDEQETQAASSNPLLFGTKAAIGNLGYAAGLGGVKVPFTPNAPKFLSAIANSKLLSPLTMQPGSLRGDIAQGVIEGVTGGIGGNVNPETLVSEAAMGGLMGGAFRGLISGGPGDTDALRLGIGPITKDQKNKMLAEGIARLRAEGKGGNEIAEFAKSLNQQFEMSKKPAVDYTDMTKQELKYTGEREPLLNTLRDVKVKTLDGQSRTIPAQEALDVYQLEGGKYYVQDGVKMVVNKGQMENIKNNSLVQREGRPFFTPEEEQKYVINKKGNMAKFKVGDKHLIDGKVYTVERVEDRVGGNADLVDEMGNRTTRSNTYDLLRPEYSGYRQKNINKNAKITDYENTIVSLREPDRQELLDMASSKGYKIRKIDNLINQETGARESGYFVERNGKVILDRNLSRANSYDMAENNLLREMLREERYTAQHFQDIPDVVFHRRTETLETPRKNAPAERALMDIEVQSDINQDIRNYNQRERRLKSAKIYKTNDPTRKEFVAGVPYGKDIAFMEGNTPEEALAKLRESYLNENGMGRLIKENDLRKKYQETSIKTALLDAVDKGADKYAWATGEQTSNMWHQREVGNITEIEWKRTEDGLYDGKLISQELRGGGGRAVEEFRNMTPQMLKDELGIKDSYIKKMESGKDNVFNDSLARLTENGKIEYLPVQASGVIKGKSLTAAKSKNWAYQAYDVSRVKAAEDVLRELGIKPQKQDLGYLKNPNDSTRNNIFKVDFRLENIDPEFNRLKSSKYKKIRATKSNLKSGDLIVKENSYGESIPLIVIETPKDTQTFIAGSSANFAKLSDRLFKKDLKLDDLRESSFNEIVEKAWDEFQKVENESKRKMLGFSDKERFLNNINYLRDDFLKNVYYVDYPISPKREKQWTIPITRQVEDLVKGKPITMRETSGRPLPKTMMEVLSGEEPNPKMLNNEPTYYQGRVKEYQEARVKALEEARVKRLEMAKAKREEAIRADVNKFIADIRRINQEDGKGVKGLKGLSEMSINDRKALYKEYGLKSSVQKNIENRINNASGADLYKSRIKRLDEMVNVGYTDNYWRSLSEDEKIGYIKRYLQEDADVFLSEGNWKDENFWTLYKQERANALPDIETENLMGEIEKILRDDLDDEAELAIEEFITGMSDERWNTFDSYDKRDYIRRNLGVSGNREEEFMDDLIKISNSNPFFFAQLKNTIL